MTERQVIIWIRKELGPIIDAALSQRPGVIYTPDWLGGMAYREVGILLHRFIPQNQLIQAIAPNMRGDYGQRPGDPEKMYHGFGFWQIDIASYPDFVRSGLWRDPLKTCLKAIDVLEEKRLYLEPRFKLAPEKLHRAITAAYNCGQGNVAKVLKTGADIDSRTHGKDYSKAVWRYREVYRSI